MKNNKNLFNAAVIGENPETAFLVEGDHLRAVEKSIADLKKDKKSDPKNILPLMRNALKELIIFAEGKVEKHFLEIDWKTLTDQPNEQSRLVSIIHNIYSHLPHHEHNELSSLIHHKQALK